MTYFLYHTFLTILFLRSMKKVHILTSQGMNSTRPLKVYCGIWHQNVSSKSFKSCKLRGGASIDRICLSSTSHTDIRCGNLEVKSTPWSLCPVPKPFLNNSLCIMVLYEVTALTKRECTWVKVGGSCQNNIHMIPRVSQFVFLFFQNPVCLPPIVHPGAISSQVYTQVWRQLSFLIHL